MASLDLSIKCAKINKDIPSAPLRLCAILFILSYAAARELSFIPASAYPAMLSAPVRTVQSFEALHTDRYARRFPT